jgi:hypothetical protein
MEFKKENYSTHVPNVFFDEYMPELKLNELKVLLAIIRLTIGFKAKLDPTKRKQNDWISIKRFEQVTGLSRRSISSAIESLLFKQLIEATNKEGAPLLTTYQRRGRQRIYFSCRLCKVQKLQKTSVNQSFSQEQLLHPTKRNATNIKLHNTKQKSNMWKSIGEIFRLSNSSINTMKN